jgi:hypothetical protein
MTCEEWKNGSTHTSSQHQVEMVGLLHDPATLSPAENENILTKVAYFRIPTAIHLFRVR